MVSKREVVASAKDFVARGIRALDAGMGVRDLNDASGNTESVFVGEYLLNAPVDHGPLDELWYETLEQEAAKRGAFYEPGEGDPNDIFIGRYLKSARRCACAPKPAKRTTKRRK